LFLLRPQVAEPFSEGGPFFFRVLDASVPASVTVLEAPLVFSAARLCSGAEGRAFWFLPVDLQSKVFHALWPKRGCYLAVPAVGSIRRLFARRRLALLAKRLRAGFRGGLFLPWPQVAELFSEGGHLLRTGAGL
jgi:hypothetical protein